LLSVLRDQLDFGEVPIKLFLQKRPQNDERDTIGGVGRMEGNRNQREREAELVGDEFESGGELIEE